MRRRLGMLIAAALLAGLFTFVPSSPVSAHPDVCAGPGVAYVAGPGGLGLYYPHLGPHAMGYVFNFALVPPGTCVGPLGPLGAHNPFNAVGTVAGYCGFSTGNGLAAGHPFAFVGIGGLLVIGPNPAPFGMYGAALATPNAFAGEGCSNATDAASNGANQFLIAGAVVLV
jgi:hypothetical protein